MEDEFPTWCRRVNTLSQGDKIDPSIFEEVERLDKIFERAPQAIKFSDHHGMLSDNHYCRWMRIIT